MSKVFVAHDSKVTLDRDVASAFGEITFVNHRYIFNDDISDTGHPPSGFIDNMRQAVSQFNPEDDYLMIAGDQLQVLMLAVALSRAYGQFKVLRWDRQAEGYYPVVVRGADFDLGSHVRRR